MAPLKKGTALVIAIAYADYHQLVDSSDKRREHELYNHAQIIVTPSRLNAYWPQNCPECVPIVLFCLYGLQ
jgi:hypothetical protein